MTTLIVDNFDSFTYNLAHMVAALRGIEPIVVKNDTKWSDIPWDKIDSVIISPGPGSPGRHEDFGICAEIIASCDLPLLGVCLGHQGICEIAGGKVVRAPAPMHGRSSRIEHDGSELFTGIPRQFDVIRYHSLAVVDVPDTLQVTARSADGVVMAIKHLSRPIWGVQFHPESIGTQFGREIIANFCRIVRDSIQQELTDVGSESESEYVVNVRRLPNMPVPDSIASELFAESPNSFRLDSGGTLTDGRARFSILGDSAGPLAEVVSYDVNKTELTSIRQGRTRTLNISIFDYLSNRRSAMAPKEVLGLDLEFELGFVGFLGYEMKAETGGSSSHKSALPDAAFIFADRAVVHDNRDGSGWLLALSSLGSSPETGPEQANKWLDEAEDRLGKLAAVCHTEPIVNSTGIPSGIVTMRHDHKSYLDKINRTLGLIFAGESYEICLTNEGSASTQADHVGLYDEMRRLSPAPFGALLRFGDLSVLSASPERFMSVSSSGKIESRPIKGTRARGENAQEDDRIRSELQTSVKDRAENLMIVDLVRNDLSRVCEVGTVRVPALFEVETFATVHQLVSTVTGQLRPGMTSIDAVRAAFPGGSMTGAPKIRTMELIDELEAGPRGIYSGALGWFSLTGACDLSIVIRTIVVDGKSATFGTGGAILALSDPEDEWQETLVKSTVMRALLEQAGQSPVESKGLPA